MYIFGFYAYKPDRFGQVNRYTYHIAKPNKEKTLCGKVHVDELGEETIGVSFPEEEIKKRLDTDPHCHYTCKTCKKIFLKEIENSK
ncbi:hypothetical protein [Persephonella sp. KM09-Lau-8]|uniref:hypothetical protein n=1 Tax=Persephonella sp. KM09-Lau-8 TaxID=1158345 RepID=UPI0004950C06|nr:hypothetical protein [Persephonella sp. KM09-Lau-8]